MGVWQQLLAICSGIAIICGAGAWVVKIVKPALGVKERLDKLEATTNQYIAMLKSIESDNRLQNRLLLSMINHQIDGNGIDSMKKIREEMIDLLNK